MLHWFGTIADELLSWGYLGVFAALVIEGLGLPFPGDAVMAFYGFAAAHGQAHAGGVIGFSIVGYMAGTVFAYRVSHQYGAGLFDRIGSRFLLDHRSMTRASRLIDQYGPWLLIPGRFLPGVRSVSSYVAGASHMEFQPFLVYTGIGASLWCATWVGLGYWFGENMDVVLHAVQSSLAYVTGAGLVLLLALWAYRRRVR